MLNSLHPLPKRNVHLQLAKARGQEKEGNGQSRDHVVVQGSGNEP